MAMPSDMNDDHSQRLRPKGQARSALLEFLLASSCCLFILLWFYHSHLFQAEIKFTANYADPLIQAAILEHWRNVFQGKEHWLDPIFFYPIKNVLGMNDAYFGYGVIYSIYRLIGFDQLASTELVAATFRAIGFCATWLLLRKVFATGLPAALLGAALVTASNGIYLGTQHTQLATIGLTPLFLLLLCGFFRQLDNNRWGAAALSGAFMALLLSVWIMTAFYTVFMTLVFLLTGLIVAAVAARPLLWRWLRLLFTKRALLAMTPGVCLLLLGLIPFALTYYPIAKLTGMHSWAEALYYAPSPADLLNIGPDNLVWTKLLEKFGVLDFSNTERWRGFTLIELALVLVVASRRGWRAADTPDPGRALAVIVALTVALGLLLEVKIGGRSLWALVYQFVPGGKGVRVVVRYQLVLLVAGALVAAVVMDRLLRARDGRSRALAVVLAVALVAEQINLTPIASLSRKDVAAAVIPIPEPPGACRSFYATHPPVPSGAGSGERKFYIHTTQAMLVAETLGLPTLNGMDSFIPPDSNLFDPLDDTYEARAYLYAWRHQLLDGLCAYDLTTRQWRVVTTPPQMPAANPFGSGLQPDIPLAFSEGQEGAPLLGPGWSAPESWGVWATGVQSGIDLKLNASAFADGAELSFFLRTLLPQSLDQKPLSVEIVAPDGSHISGSWMIGRDEAEQKLCVPKRLLQQARLRVTIRAEQSFSPMEIGIGGDQRVLDFALTKLVARNAACSN